uniref:Phlebovirus glycoprotein G2 fusion domain-containing protein n=1 Tax=Heterorhabditis bacteriophora TaxID=37862 RepID=A0A1I7WG22_HETBA
MPIALNDFKEDAVYLHSATAQQRYVTYDVTGRHISNDTRWRNYTSQIQEQPSIRENRLLKMHTRIVTMEYAKHVECATATFEATCTSERTIRITINTKRAMHSTMYVTIYHCTHSRLFVFHIYGQRLDKTLSSQYGLSYRRIFDDRNHHLDHRRDSILLHH